MGLLAILHRYGVNTALLAGLVLMPALVAVGYWADGRGVIPGLALRGCFEPDTPGGAPPLPDWSRPDAAMTPR